MKKNRILTITMLTAFVYSYSFAADVYIYNGGEGNLLHTLKYVQKITFTNDEMNITLADKSVKDIKFSDFNFFSFKPKGDYTSLVQETTDDISVSFNGVDILSIQSENIISKVELYSMQGLKLKEAGSDLNHYNLSLASYPVGIYLVNIVTEGKTVTHKIIKR